MRRLRRGVDCEDIALGDGPVGVLGSKVVITYTLALNKGKVVESDKRFEFRLGSR